MIKSERAAASPSPFARGRAPAISVVIPTLDEERALPATLGRLRRQPGRFEVIVADGGSRDRTCELASRAGASVLAAPAGRASQMNAGAGRAAGEWLLFLHADTLLPEGALLAVEQLGDEVAAGGFRHRFSGRGWELRVLSFLNNLRTRRTRIIYGDQALFVRRRLFETLGGFPDRPVLEDIAFCERLLTVTRPVILSDAVVTDARKFREMGVWRSAARAAIILLCLRAGLPIPRAALRFFENVR